MRKLKKYYESIQILRPDYLGGGQWTISNLTPVTVIFGKNGSGKSILLRSLRDNNNKGHHYIIPERSGDLSYQPQFLEGQLSADGRRSMSSANFSNDYRRTIVARIQAYFMARGNFRGDKLPGDPADLELLLNRLIPDFTVELVGTSNPPYRIVRVSDNGVVGNITGLSSGEAQILTIAIDAVTIAAIWDLQNEEPRVLLIDEPDAHIHPDLQVRFADFIVAVGELFKMQIVVATHSTTLLAALGLFGADDASVLYLDRLHSKFSAIPFSRAHREITACLGGHVLMGPLFGVPLLLVEGDDDYRIWSQVPRHHVTSFAVIPCNGEEIKDFQRILERMLGSLRDGAKPAGYALLDADKGMPIPQDGSPQEHIKFVQLACHESENLYLTDETLSLLDLKWEQASKRIVDEADKFGKKAEQLKAIAVADRKTSDVKDVIGQITQILDPKNVHWTIRVAKALGVKKPEGQIAEFLGPKVIEALWP